MRKTIVAMAILFSLAALPALAQQSERVRGAVTAIGDGQLSVKTSDGETVSVKLAPNFNLTGVVKAKLADIKPGSFIGVGARPQADGTLKAIQVFVFPEAMRGRGEGHRAWGVLPETTMTNATVESAVSNVDGPTVMLKYPGGEKKVVIPPDANVITAVAVTKSVLVNGAEVSLVAQKQADGSFQTDRINVAQDGAKLPL